MRAANPSLIASPKSKVARLPSQDAALQGNFAHRLPVRLARHAVHDAARPAAAEDHRIRALQDLDAIEVVQVAVVLDVVAHAVEEEVAGRAVAAQDDRVAVALALRHARARDVARDVHEALHGLVLDQVAGDHGDRLRHVDERRVRLGGGPAALGEVALGFVLADDRHLRQGCRRRLRGVIGGCGMHGGHCEYGKDRDSKVHGFPRFQPNENYSQYASEHPGPCR